MITALSESFRKASVVFFYRNSFVTHAVFARISGHMYEQDQSFTFCQDEKGALQ
jgi:hypothetical protein